MNETQMQPVRRPVGRQRNPVEKGCIHLPPLHVPHKAKTTRRRKVEPVHAPDLPPRYTSREAKACILWAIAAVLLILTPYIFILADIREERRGVGSEGIAPIIAVVLIGVGVWMWANRGERRIETIFRERK